MRSDPHWTGKSHPDTTKVEPKDSGKHSQLGIQYMKKNPKMSKFQLHINLQQLRLHYLDLDICSQEGIRSSLWFQLCHRLLRWRNK